MTTLDKLRVTAQTWDSDKDVHLFHTWIRSFGSMVRILKHGEELENFLDAKLDRSRPKEMTTPSFILKDSDFALNPPPGMARSSPTRERGEEDEDEEETHAETTSPVLDTDTTSAAVSEGNKTFVLPSVDTPYWDLPEKSRELDALLYSTMLTCVKGTKRHLLMNGVSHPSYVQCVVILTKHMDISRVNRKAACFKALLKMEYRGDAHAFQTVCMARIAELQDSGANLTDFILYCLLHAFDGKCKILQYRISEDLNRMNVDERTPIYDMVQSYCSDLASVGDSRQSRVHMAHSPSQDTCRRCGRTGHREKQCFARTHKNGSQLTSTPPASAPSKGGKGAGKPAHVMKVTGSKGGKGGFRRKRRFRKGGRGKFNSDVVSSMLAAMSTPSKKGPKQRGEHGH